MQTVVEKLLGNVGDVEKIVHYKDAMKSADELYSKIKDSKERYEFAKSTVTDYVTSQLNQVARDYDKVLKEANKGFDKLSLEEKQKIYKEAFEIAGVLLK